MTKLSCSDIENLFLKVMDLDDADKSEIVARVFGIMEACRVQQVSYHPDEFFRFLESFVEKDTKK